jgi:probable phosphoglycerate mutase
VRILIIRHGDPNYEKDCLTEKGRREATLLAKRLQTEEISAFYSSPYGRAKETCDFVARVHGREADVQVLDWLKEFDCDTVFPSGRTLNIPWDMLPEEWASDMRFYDHKTWYDHPTYKTSKVKEQYLSVTKHLDELVKKHGYTRDGDIYRVEKRNRDTIAIFCHFGTESVLLSRLCNVSPISIWHNFVAVPSSLTTVYTEERREGKAIFRCAGFGDIGHLYEGGETPSFSARFCETFGSGERQD